MSPTSLPCPNCQRVLCSAVEIPAGKKVKCPNCQCVFVAGEETRGQGIQAKPRVSVQPPAAIPRFQQPDSEDSWDEEDRRPQKRSKKKSNIPLIVLLSFGALLLVSTLGLTAYYFLSSSNGPGPLPGGPDPLAFAPPTSTAVVSANLLPFRNQPEKLKIIHKALDEKANLTPAQKELFKDLVHFVAAGKAGPNAGPNKEAVLIFLTAQPQDPEKIRQAFDAGQGEIINGKRAYSLPNGQGFLGMPDPRIVIVAPGQGLFAQAMAGQGLSPQMRAKVKNLERATFWFHVDVNAQFFNQGGGLNGKLGALESAQALNGFFDMGPQAGFLKAQVQVHFPNEAEAKKLESSARLGWAQVSIMLPFLTQGLMQKPGPVADAIQAGVNDLTKTVKIEGQGNQVNFSAEITEPTMTLLGRIDEKTLQEFFQGMPGGLPFPGR